MIVKIHLAAAKFLMRSLKDTAWEALQCSLLNPQLVIEDDYLLQAMQFVYDRPSPERLKDSFIPASRYRMAKCGTDPGKLEELFKKLAEYAWDMFYRDVNTNSGCIASYVQNYDIFTNVVTSMGSRAYVPSSAGTKNGRGCSASVATSGVESRCKMLRKYKSRVLIAGYISHQCESKTLVKFRFEGFH